MKDFDYWIVYLWAFPFVASIFESHFSQTGNLRISWKIQIDAEKPKVKGKEVTGIEVLSMSLS